MRGAAKPTIQKDLRYGHENQQHADQTELFRQKESGENDSDDELNQTCSEGLEEGPEDAF